MARNTNVTGTNPHPNGPSPEWQRIQKELNKNTKMLKKYKGKIKGVGNPIPWKNVEPKTRNRLYGGSGG